MENVLNKLKVILEKNVEWIAVALGALFLLWMVYGYVIQKPVTATVDHQQLSPADVDQKVADGPVRELQAAMANPAVPKMEVQDFITDLMKRLDPAAGAVLAMNTPWSGLPLDQSFIPAPPPAPTLVQHPVTQLPVAAAPEDLKVEQGRSNVQVPPPPAAAAAGQGNGSAIVQLSNNDGTPQDRNWVSVSAMIRTKPLADALAKVNVPNGPLHMISILRVELIRQEQDANGNWGPDQTIPPLSTVNLLPLPSQQAAILDQTAYIAWAEQNQQALLQPPFYTVLQADPWVVPGMPQPHPQMQVPEQPFDPANFHGDTDELTPDQKKQYDDYQKQQREARMQAARAREQSEENSGPPRGPMGAPPGMGGRPAVDDPDRPLTLAQAAGQPGYGGYGGGGPRNFVPPPFDPRFGRPPFGRPNMPPMPQEELPPQNPDDAMANSPLANPAATLPQGGGAFDPATKVPPDIVIWAHDDSVEPGKTYRYKIHYIIKNPVFQTQNVCNPQSLAQQFYIVSDDSDWTDEISIKSETNLFAVSTSPLRNSVPVKFDIFRWSGGAWRRQTDTVNPGDEIGSVDSSNNVDFNTGLTLVDVHTDPRNPDNHIITLMSDSGQISHHELPDDHNNPEHKRLNTIVNSEPKPGTPGAPGTPGTPGAPTGSTPSASVVGPGPAMNAGNSGEGE